MYVYIILHAYTSLHFACSLSSSVFADNATKSARCSSRRHQHAQQQLKRTRGRVAFQQAFLQLLLQLCRVSAELHAVVAQYLLLLAQVACVDEKKHGGWKKQRMRVWKKEMSLSTSVPPYLYRCLYLCLCVSICVLSVPSTLCLYLLLFILMSCLIAGEQTGGSCTKIERR